MERTRRHGIYYLLALVFVLVLYTVLYKFGMAVFEGVQRSFLESLQIVVESMTTTGYGEDAALWSAPPILGLMIVMQATGVFFVFLTLPLFVVPWIQRRLEPTIPEQFDGEGHVVVCGFSSIGDKLVDELESHGLEAVVVIDDGALARELVESGYTVVLGDPEDQSVLEAASISRARAVVLDEDDERNANVALAVREVDESVEVAAFVDEPARANYLDLAGVDTTLHPRELVAEGLAKEVSRIVNTQLQSTIEVDSDIRVIELPILHGSPLVGRQIQTAGIRERSGANVIGAWLDGDFVPNPRPDTQLNEKTVLLVSGTEPQLQRLVEWATPAEKHPGSDAVMAGYGTTGQAVCRALEAAQVDCTVIDRADREGVDVVGDATDPSTLDAAGIETANALIVTVSDDSEAIFITLLARDLNPDLEIVVRANDAENRSKLVAAGADYVLPIATVSARMLAGTIMGEEIIAYETQIEIVRTTAPNFADQTVGAADVGERTGCTILAVERDGETHSGIDADFEIRRDDALVVAGTDDGVERFKALAGSRDE